MSGAAYYDCPCGARFHESEMPGHWQHVADRVEKLEAAIADGERYATEYGFDTSHRIRARLRQALSIHPTESEKP